MSNDAKITVKITPEAWAIICDENKRGELLDAVENGTESEFLYALGIEAVKTGNGGITFGVKNDRP